MKIIDQNRKAYHDYFIEDTFEAGIVLTGTEIKSIRQGRINLKDAFVRIKQGEAYLWNANIAVYDHGNIFNHDPTQTRKLLLHKHQIKKIEKEARENGMTVVPLKVYLKNGRAKVEIAIAKGKKLYDKRQSLKEKDAKREMEKSMKGRFYD